MIKFFDSAENYFNCREAFPDYLQAVTDTVYQIIRNVRQNGDRAVREYTNKFDQVDLEQFKVQSEYIEQAVQQMDSEIKAILLEAAENIRRFHQKQLPKSWLSGSKKTAQLGQKFTPVQRVGVYIPGGIAAYPSSVLMNVIPAQIAKVPRIIAISPPKAIPGFINPIVLGTLGLLGISEIYAIGGSQGIAALAYGTESIPQVYKITGPGNAYVMEAKKQVFGQVGIDSLAGPTELAVIADETANPDFIARDLMSQAEHDIHAATVLITPSEKLMQQVDAALETFVPVANRTEILKESFKNYGSAIKVKSLGEAVSVANEIAPEHLEILTTAPEELVNDVQNAGAIFWGEYSSEPVGDYWAGPNHILPTNGTAKFSSPLGVLDFMKYSSLIHYSKEELVAHAAKIEKFAQLEGLYNHSKSIEVRHE